MTIHNGQQRPWTAVVRGKAASTFPGDKLLPDQQPSYVSSWIYVFGVASLSALVVVLGSGLVLAMAGPQWFHISTLGRFVNSVHLWSVELFFFSMVLHLWGKFMMAAWRGRRALTWVTGVVAFLGSILTSLTGYLIQSNFESQWVATQAKDGLNSVGIGGWLNVLDFGQMLLLHVAFLPLVVGVLVLVHVLLVRRHGVVAPYSDEDLDDGPDESGDTELEAEIFEPARTFEPERARTRS
jgi:ubiquinol-cytochrome c reductase cytochrome b subunit